MCVFVLRDITDDEAFVDELRVTLRFFAAVLVRRTQKVRIQNTWGHISLSLHSSVPLRWMWRPSSHKSFLKFQ